MFKEVSPYELYVVRLLATILLDQPNNFDSVYISLLRISITSQCKAVRCKDVSTIILVVEQISLTKDTIKS